MEKTKRRRPITDAVGLPAEILPRVPKLTLSGGSEAFIENHGGLMSYTTECVEIRGREGFLRINGDELELIAMTKTDIIVRGLIISVEFC